MLPLACYYDKQFYQETLPEAVCCCLQTCNVYIKKLAMGYMSIPSFIILGSWIYELHHINGLYHNVFLSFFVVYK